MVRSEHLFRKKCTPPHGRGFIFKFFPKKTPPPSELSKEFFFEIFLKFFWNFFEIFLKFFWNFFEIFLKFFWNFFEIFLKFFWNFFEIFLKFFWNFFEWIIILINLLKIFFSIFHSSLTFKSFLCLSSWVILIKQ